MSNEALQKIKQRIMALLAKANGTDNEHEAEAFLGKANDLLQQYQLDIGDLVAGNDPILNHPGLHAAHSGHAWRWKLYHAVGAMYGCKSIMENGLLRDEDGKVVSKNGKVVDAYTLRLVGRESAIITVDLMYPWIVSQVRAAAKQLAPLTGMSEQGQAKRVAAALINRIWGLVNAEKAQNARQPQTAVARNALMTLDAVEAKFQELAAGLESKKVKPSKSDALSRRAAQDIGLHRQTGGASQLKLGN